jgi:FkbM family methyltransferase
MTHRLLRTAAPVLQPLRRCRLVNEPIRFFAADLLRLRGRGAYTVASCDTRIVIRHEGYEDAFIIDEVFGPTRAYDLPAQAVGRVADVRRIVDLGANIGLASLRLLAAFPDSQALAVEPEPSNARLLETNLALNGLLGRSTILRAAAGAEAGTVMFAGGRGGSSHVAVDGEDGNEVAKVDILPELVVADLLKMDIEGGEWEILTDPRFPASTLKAVCLEYHARCCPAESPRALVMEILTEADFTVMDLRGSDEVGTLWAVR